MTSPELDEEAVFHVAREIPSAEARSTYLKQVCAGDQALRERVEALLDVHEQEQDFLKSSPGPAATVDHLRISEGPGHQIGRYKLLQKIGEGGVGVVYMAEQVLPLRRKVALKIIKPGMDTGAVVARFEAERQALALMDHQNIARVLDAGSTDGGRPFFVMELVKGITVTDYCDKNRVSARDRLLLFATICDAVQHAHQKGVIHRDLKPSNIMITPHDGQPIVKIIDFGIAKALNQQLTEKTLFTAYGQMIGTPQYMSPEQAEMSGLDVDTRSDVYSLGAVLYELMTGTAPIDAGSLHDAPVADIQRMVKETVPPRPSVRLITSGEKLTEIAERRSVDAKALQRVLRGDLDWIVMKALEKERDRRYASASQFAADVRRFLEGETVEAHPPSTLYRLRTFVRRNRVATIAAVTMLLALFVAAFATIFGMMIAQHQTFVAERRAYIADMNVAMQAWEENNVKRVREILSRYRDSDPGFEWRYLWNLCQKIRGARSLDVSDKAHEVVFSPAGQTLAVAYGHGSVELFDVATLESKKKFDCHRQDFYPFVAFSGDGRKLARASSDKATVVVEDLFDEKATKLSSNPGTVHEAAFSPDGKLLAVGAGHTVVLWDLDQEAAIDKFVHADEVWSLAFSPDGKQVASGTNDGVITLWDIGEGERLRTVVPPSSYLQERRLRRIWCLAFSTDGHRLAAGCGDWTVRLYDVATIDTSLPVTFSTHSDEVRSVSFSSKLNVLASASRDGTVKLWDIQDYRELDTLKGYSFGGHSCSFSPDGNLLASGGVDYRVLLWDLTPKRNDAVQTTTVARTVDHRYDVVFSSDGQTVLLLSEEARETVRVLRTSDWRERKPIDAASAVQCIAVSKDARVALGMRGVLSLWDLQYEKMLVSREADLNVTALAFNDKNGTLIVGLEDGTILIWPREAIENGAPKRVTVTAHQGAVTCLGVSGDGGRLASGGADHKVMVWDLPTLQWRCTLDKHRDRVLCLAFSPTDDLLATGALEHEKALCLWDLSVVDPDPRVLMSARAVYSVAFSPNGNILFAAHGDNTVRLWDVASGQQRLRLRGHDSAVQSLALSQDGLTLLSGDRYGTIRLWRAASHEQVAADPMWWSGF